MTWIEDIVDLPGTLNSIVSTLARMEKRMADLSQAVSDLTTAVAGVAERVGPAVTQLKADLAAAQQAVSDITALDEADKAALTAALDTAQASADSIEGQVTSLNEIAATPAPDDPPVDPAPVDPPPAP